MAYFRIDCFSSVLDMATNVIVTAPDGIDLGKAPVVLLLHGLSDNASGWSRYTRCEQYGREKGVIFVMPEVQRSFYMDMDEGLDYLTFITRELPQWIRKTFRFDGEWYVMGLSMGGYGAMKCGLLRRDLFRGIAAFSAVADIRAWFSMHDDGERRAIRRTIGDEDDLYHLFREYGQNSRLFLSCGTEDGLYRYNRELSDYLDTLPVMKETWFDRGTHSWRFWDESLSRALDYYFGK